MLKVSLINIYNHGTVSIGFGVVLINKYKTPDTTLNSGL